MLRITGAKGFQMTFDNGWTVSVQFGYGNYCENRHKKSEQFYEGSRLTHDVNCKNAEVARWHGDNSMDEPSGWLTADEVAAFIAETAALPAPPQTPVHEHDCDNCVYITSYPLRHPYVDDADGYRTGVPFKPITHGDIYHTCETGKSFYKYIVRYGTMGEYATTNEPSRYLLAPWIDGVDDFAREW